MKYKLRCALLILAVTFTVACGPTPATAGSAPVPSASSAPIAVASARIGTVVELGNWRYQVMQVDTAPEVDDGYFAKQLKPKGLWVIVLVDLTNIGRENFSINSHDFELRDDKGIRYAMDYRADDLARAGGQVALGEKMPPTVKIRTTLLYDVAPGTTGMYLYLLQGKGTIQLR